MNITTKKDNSISEVSEFYLQIGKTRGETIKVKHYLTGKHKGKYLALLFLTEDKVTTSGDTLEEALQGIINLIESSP